MTEQREKLINRLATSLGIHANATSSLSGAGLNNRQVLSELLFCQLINGLYGWELISANIVKANTAAVDLVDKNRRIGVQVSGRGSKILDKINKTLAIFNKDGLNKDYDHLYFVIFVANERVDKRDVRGGDVVHFDVNKHIIDRSAIIRQAQTLSAEQLAPIVEAFEAGVMPNYGDNHNVIVTAAHSIALTLKKGVNPGPIGAIDPEGALSEGLQQVQAFEASPAYGNLRGITASNAKIFIELANVTIWRLQVLIQNSSPNQRDLEAWENARIAWVALEQQYNKMKGDIG